MLDTECAYFGQSQNTDFNANFLSGNKLKVK